MPKVKLTQKLVDGMALAAEGQQLYFDTDLKGFGLCVGRKTKTYFAQFDVKGRTVRTKIGHDEIFRTDDARKRARALLLDMANGVNPNTVKRETLVRTQALGELFSKYIEQSKKRLRERTIEGYEDHMEHRFEQWKETPIAEVTKAMIEKKHKEISDEIGLAAANNAMKFLRTLYNFARFDNESLINPVSVLSQKKLWNTIERRRSVIRDHQLSAWYGAVMALKNETVRDLLLFLLFTGLRKREAMTLRWGNIDLKSKTFIVTETKNHTPLELPLSTFLERLLKKRRELTAGSDWVFPGKDAKNPIQEFKRMVTNVEDASGVKFMPHDLRRTFTTIAERLDISTYALKSLINHRTGNNDVTAGYIVMNVDIRS